MMREPGRLDDEQLGNVRVLRDLKGVVCNIYKKKCNVCAEGLSFSKCRVVRTKAFGDRAGTAFWIVCRRFI